MTCPRCVTPSTCSWNGCSPGTRPAEAHECTPNSLGECGKCGKQNVGEWPINKVRRCKGEFPITQAEHVAGGVALLKSATELIEAIGRHNEGMPQTSKEKQEAFRARQAMLGHTEVRGVFLPPALHAAIKEEARKLLARHSRNNPAEKQD